MGPQAADSRDAQHSSCHGSASATFVHEAVTVRSATHFSLVSAQMSRAKNDSKPTIYCPLSRLTGFRHESAFFFELSDLFYSEKMSFIN